MKNAIEKFNAMVEAVGHHFDYDTKVSKDTTIGEVANIVADLEWLKDQIEELIDIAKEMNITPHEDKNEVSTIGELVSMGYTAEQAVIVREHDILWNRCTDSVITLGEYERLEEIWSMNIV